MSRSKAAGPLIPVRGQTEVPKQPPVTIVITRQQVEGILDRQRAALAANGQLNDFMGGIITGHGYDAAQVTHFDAAKRTLTLIPLPKPTATP